MLKVVMITDADFIRLNDEEAVLVLWTKDAEGKSYSVETFVTEHELEKDFGIKKGIDVNTNIFSLVGKGCHIKPGNDSNEFVKFVGR